MLFRVRSILIELIYDQRCAISLFYNFIHYIGRPCSQRQHKKRRRSRERGRGILRENDNEEKRIKVWRVECDTVLAYQALQNVQDRDILWYLANIAFVWLCNLMLYFNWQIYRMTINNHMFKTNPWSTHIKYIFWSWYIKCETNPIAGQKPVLNLPKINLLYRCY